MKDLNKIVMIIWGFLADAASGYSQVSDQMMGEAIAGHCVNGGRIRLQNGGREVSDSRVVYATPEEMAAAWKSVLIERCEALTEKDAEKAENSCLKMINKRLKQAGLL